jgi:phosphohistidine phosphatase SixA
MNTTFSEIKSKENIVESKKTQRIFLLRHASYSIEVVGESDPILSYHGNVQAKRLAKALFGSIGKQKVSIWTSPARRASQTADVIKKLFDENQGSCNLFIKEKLWSDSNHHHDFGWLKNEIENCDEENLVIISHLEYVQDFPSILNYPHNNAGYAQGVLITNNKCMNFVS